MLHPIPCYKHGPPNGGQMLHPIPCYKHGPPNGGRMLRPITSINMDLLTEGGRAKH